MDHPFGDRVHTEVFKTHLKQKEKFLRDGRSLNGEVNVTKE